MYIDFLDGFILELALIMAVGIQNAFILRQGIRSEYVWTAALICALCETLLVSVGIAGVGAIITQVPYLITVITGCGMAFLIFYAAKSFYSAIKARDKIDIDSVQIKAKSIREVSMTAVAFSLLNPHVLLDTTLMGVISVRYTPHEWIFGAGVITGAFVWFAVLAGLGRILAKPLNKPKTWRIINVIVGILCLYIAFNFATMITSTDNHIDREEAEIMHMLKHK